MRNRMMESLRAVSSRSRPRLLPAAHRWAAAAFLFLFLGTDAQSQDTLRWKLSPGEVLRYKTEQEMRVSLKEQGKSREGKQRRNQTIYYSWKVTGVSSEGTAQVMQKIDRLVMSVEAPPYMALEWDSSNQEKAQVPEPFEPEVQQLKASIGAEFSFQIKPSGQIENIKIPEGTLKTLRDALPQQPGAQGEFSEEKLRDQLMQSVPPPFPEVALEPGKSWTSKPSKLPMPQVTMVTDRAFTYQGPDPKSPKLALIDMLTRVSLEPADNPKIRIRSQEGKGTITFDVEAGRLVSQRGSQKLEMAVSENGRTGEQITETTSAMTLIP
jgi:hypothetical protein